MRFLHKEKLFTKKITPDIIYLIMSKLHPSVLEDLKADYIERKNEVRPWRCKKKNLIRLWKVTTLQGLDTGCIVKP